MPNTRLGFSRRFKIIIFPLISAVLTALYVALDKFYLTKFSPDPYAYSFLSLWIGLIFMIVFMGLVRVPLRKGHLFGAHLDPNYKGFIIPKGKLLFWLFIAGLSSGVSSIAYFYIVGVSSPSTVIPFTRIVIIYLILAESLSEKDSPSLIETQSIIMIIIGIFLMATTDLNFDLLTILIVLVPYNLCVMVYTIALRKAKRMIYQGRRNDSLNLRFWSLAFNTITLSFLIIPFITPEFITAITNINNFIVIFITIDMIIATFAYITYIRALGIAKMSIVNSITAFAVILGIPFTLLGNLFFPGAFGSVDYSPLFWLFKSLGAFIIVAGIVVIAISQVKAYLLIYLEGSSEAVIGKLKLVKGITSISAVSGNRLLIATLKIRSLGKAYRTLVTDLEKIEGIMKVNTLTIIKDWEQL